jgi:hypothetical protein
MLGTIIFLLICLSSYLGRIIYEEKTEKFTLKRKNLRLIQTNLRKNETISRMTDRISQLELHVGNRFIQESIINAQAESNFQDSEGITPSHPSLSRRLMQ